MFDSDADKPLFAELVVKSLVVLVAAGMLMPFVRAGTEV